MGVALHVQGPWTERHRILIGDSQCATMACWKGLLAYSLPPKSWPACTPWDGMEPPALIVHMSAPPMLCTVACRDAILSTNTSTINIELVGAKTSCPGRPGLLVLGVCGVGVGWGF